MSSARLRKTAWQTLQRKPCYRRPGEPYSISECLNVAKRSMLPVSAIAGAVLGRQTALGAAEYALCFGAEHRARPQTRQTDFW